MTETAPSLPIELYANRLKPALSALGCAAALWMLWRYYNDHVSGALMKGMCVVGFLFLLLGIAAFATNAIKPRLICALTAEGLRVDRNTLIPWSAITEAKVIVYRMSFIAVMLKDPEAYVAAVPGMAQQVARTTLQKVGTPVVLQPEPAGVSAEELAEMIERERKTALNH